jgi:diguanylate cyclase (GGDEF)-like protein
MKVPRGVDSYLSRFNKALVGDQHRLWDGLGERMYFLRWVFVFANLVFSYIGNYLPFLQMIICTAVYVLLILAAEWFRRRYPIHAVFTALIPFDLVVVTYSVQTSGGIGSNVYLSYLLEVLLVTLYLGGKAGLLTTAVSMAAYLFVVYPFVQSYADFLALMYRVFNVILICLGVSYVTNHLRKQLVINQEMAQENRRLACTDLLTGLGNSRILNEELDRLLALYHTEGKGFSLLMFDCDNLKGINDVYGHDAGDRMIRQIAEAGQQIFEPAGRVLRYAGDEFYVLFGDVKEERVLELAERFVAEVSNRKIRYGTEEITTTVSVGVTFVHGEVDRDIGRHDLIRLVDQMLYQSKKQGKARLTHCHAAERKVFA